MRIWLCDEDQKRRLRTDLILPFLFAGERRLANAQPIVFPASQVAFIAAAIDLEYYGLVPVTKWAVEKGDKVVIQAGSLFINIL